MKRKNLLNLLAVVMLGVAFSIGMLSSCEVNEDTQRQGERVQESVMERAVRAYPVPEINNFLTRQAVVKWIDRMDIPDKLFYIYILADNGAMVGYFVAQYRPVSTATFLTPPQRVRVSSSGGNLLLPSPALDGTYYGEGGASSQFFFFDAETDAFIELQGLNYILMDQPLAIDIPRLRVETS